MIRFHLTAGLRVKKIGAIMVSGSAICNQTHEKHLILQQVNLLIIRLWGLNENISQYGLVRTLRFP
ncbi:MAG: hypothetical protein CMI02_18600 [Oceanospirillaceae bacterium]|nr:hypothetical protein [Oceanospirillaceae bacterium]